MEGAMVTRPEALLSENKRLRNTKGQSRMDNPETMTTFGTQDTERRQKQTQYRKLKRLATWAPSEPGVNPVDP